MELFGIFKILSPHFCVYSYNFAFKYLKFSFLVYFNFKIPFFPKHNNVISKSTIGEAFALPGYNSEIAFTNLFRKLTIQKYHDLLEE